MTSWLRRIASKPDHPMRDIKSAQRLLAELPTSDPYKSLQEITAWVESVMQAEGYRLSVRTGILNLLDEAGHAFQRKLQHEYLTQTRAAKFRERAIWRALCDYWKALVSAYILTLDAHAMGGRGADVTPAQLARLAARGLYGVVMLHKIMLLQYGPVDDVVWHALSRLWMFVESHHLESIAVSIYDHSERPTTAQAECLKTLFLAASSPDSLLPQQIDLAERTIDDLSEYLEISATPGEKSCFYYDLSAMHPPGRLVAGMQYGPRVRFIGTGQATARLQELSRALDNPSSLSVGGGGMGAPVSSLRQVLQHLLFYWSLTPPERKWPRLPAYGRLTIVHGFTDVFRAVVLSRTRRRDAGPSELELLERQKREVEQFGFVTEETQHLLDQMVSMPIELEQHAESWLVQDISLGGFGARLPQSHSDWLRIGSLIGIKTDMHAEWQVGVVRRLQVNMEQHSAIGVEVVGARVMPIAIDYAVPDEERRLENELALLFGSSLEGMEGCSVLLRGGVYLTGRQYLASEGAKRYRLEPIARREQGDGFDIVDFTIINVVED
ncbi:hypothetical protein HNQ59_003013 [Chitinivorax tropicus]|uniref:PilZ domain-containing protein n=1 Tax=Chitinivorax tropicus TaxID=714531 RepID=A0A840MQJ7_9PROT|nr:hypothetical protein [Chitinivorax tropicus]MBB5019705.1 hypothetical protein [Chitinivorax tropicus]